LTGFFQRLSLIHVSPHKRETISNSRPITASTNQHQFHPVSQASERSPISRRHDVILLGEPNGFPDEGVGLW
jgi:hypothetical protein